MSEEVAWVDFGGLVRMLAEGIAEAQRDLDRSSASLVKELSATKVSIVPELRETLDAGGNVTHAEAEQRSVSLLELGIMPTFYQFAKTTLEVAMDLTVEESEGALSREPRYRLRANTVDLQRERKLNRKVEVHSKLTATLVPVPMPARLEPARRTTEKEG